jgi:hypothetical protein
MMKAEFMTKNDTMPIFYNHKSTQILRKIIRGSKDILQRPDLGLTKYLVNTLKKSISIVVLYYDKAPKLLE